MKEVLQSMSSSVSLPTHITHTGRTPLTYNDEDRLEWTLSVPAHAVYTLQD